MTKFRMRRHGTGATYYVDDKRMDSVTGILEHGWPKSALQDWAAKKSAHFVLDNWPELCGMTPSERFDAVYNARWATVRQAATRGTDIHKLAEKTILGQAVMVPPEIHPQVSAYVRWLDKYGITPILTEAPVFNPTYGYAGRPDALVDRGGRTVMIDIKAGSGPWPEAVLQLAAYAHAEIFLNSDGEPAPLPAVDECQVIHLTPDGGLQAYDAAFRQAWPTFLHVLGVARAQGGKRMADPEGLARTEEWLSVYEGAL